MILHTKHLLAATFLLLLTFEKCFSLLDTLKIAGCIIPSDLNEVSRVALLQKCLSKDFGLGNETVCYDELGCFPMSNPWVSLLRPFPSPSNPKKIDTTLYLYTRKAPKRHVVKLWPKINLRGSDYNPKRPKTVFMTHGFASSGNMSWLSDLKDAYLQKVDANVFIVDWGKGASSFNYLQVASNTRIVGAELTRFGKYLLSQGQDPSKLHLMGHSLGAQICSYTAKGLSQARGKPGRITALDPAQPGFEGLSNEVRLHKSDASYVEVLHTDAKPFIPLIGFGMILPVGHNDFYINGGALQPGCIKKLNVSLTNILDLAKYPVEVVNEWVKCSHGRAYQVFTSALKENCWFWSRKMTFIEKAAKIATVSVASFLDPVVEKLSDCQRDTCSVIGLDAPDLPARGSFSTQTSGENPYCVGDEEVDDQLKSLFTLGLGTLVSDVIKGTSNVLNKLKPPKIGLIRKLINPEQSNT